MKKLIRHRWLKIEFNKWECAICGLQKFFLNGRTVFQKFGLSYSDPGCDIPNSKKFKAN
jgi:hypothetical protein